MLKITKLPTGEKVSEDFQIMLNGISAKAYTARVSAMPFNCIWPGHQRALEQTEEAPVLTFSMDEAVNVELLSDRLFEEVVVRPLSAGIVPKRDGKTIRFTIEKAGQYTVELDGPHRALHIFANPYKEFDVSPEDEDVIYFGPGVHHPGVISLESNQTVYIDQDAVVYGSILAICAEQIRILGYGILDGSEEIRKTESMLVPIDMLRRNPDMDVFSPVQIGEPVAEPVFPIVGSVLLESKEQFLSYLEKWNVLHGCIRLYQCTNALIEGVVLRDASSYAVTEANCTNVVCDNVKLIGMWRYNSDGIDIFNSQNCIVRNSFLRNFDDCIVLKGNVGWDTWNEENIVIENCVLWCDWGRNLEIGAETNAPEYRNILFRNCDCIHTTWVALDIQHCDRANVHDITFEDIRVEYSRYDRKIGHQADDNDVYREEYGMPTLICIELSEHNAWAHEKQKGKVSRVTYRNIQVLTEEEAPFPEVKLIGIDKEHAICDVIFENMTHNGKPILDSSVIQCNEFVTNVILH